MRKTSLLILLTAFWAGGCAAQSVDGRRVHLTAGDHVSRHVPVYLPYEDPSLGPDTRVQVIEDKTGEGFPATVRAGGLVFVAKSAMANTEHTYRVKALKGSDRPHVVIVKKRFWGDQIEVSIDDQPFTVYNFSDEHRKPFLWPICAEGGITVTRSWPMGPAEPIVIPGRTRRRSDHPHQKSLWTAHGDVNGTDHWGEGSERSGYQHTESLDFGSGDAYGWIESRIIWQDNSHKPILTENREYRFYAGSPKARIFDVITTWTATEGDVLFKDTKEGGIVGIRVREHIRGDNKGSITNSNGQKGEKECWGKAAAWCDYSGPIDDFGVRGIAVFDHPSNLRHPTHWHVRDYGLMAANCFGLSYFIGKGHNGDCTLEQGESVTFHYRVYVHAGDVDEARVAERYADYATPPEVSWLD